MVPMSSVPWNFPFMGLQIYDDGFYREFHLYLILNVFWAGAENSVWNWLDCSFDRDSHNSWSKSKGDQSENARSLYLIWFYMILILYDYVWPINQPGLVSLLMHITSHNFPKPNTMKPRTAYLFTAMHPTVGRMVDDTSGAYSHRQKSGMHCRLRPSTVWRKLHLATYMKYDEYMMNIKFIWNFSTQRL